MSPLGFADFCEGSVGGDAFVSAPRLTPGLCMIPFTSFSRAILETEALFMVVGFPPFFPNFESSQQVPNFEIIIYLYHIFFIFILTLFVLQQIRALRRTGSRFPLSSSHKQCRA